jgi:hypothetical protein
MELSRWFTDARNHAATPLETPTLSELKSHIKITKAENKTKYGKDANKKPILWDFGEDARRQCRLLLDILTACPDATITCSTLNRPL